MTKRHKFMLTFWHVTVIGTLLSAGTLLAFILCWTLQPFGKEVIQFPQGLVVREQVVKAGDNITIDAPYCKNINTYATNVSRWFQDELTYYLPAQIGNVKPGCNETYKTVVAIPSNLPPDTYTYNLTFTYQINPIKTQQYTFTTNEFKVVNSNK